MIMVGAAEAEAAGHVIVRGRAAAARFVIMIRGAEAAEAAAAGRS